MKVLITFALANEFAPWRRLRRFERVSVDAWDQTYVAQVGLCDVRVVLTGAGRFATQRALAHAFDHDPDVCIASGLSGALKPGYAPGDVLAARMVADVRATRLFHSDAELVSRSEASGAKIVDKFLVTDQVISTAEEKRALSTSGDAVDMESLYVLAAAGQRGIRSRCDSSHQRWRRFEPAARFRRRIRRREAPSAFRKLSGRLFAGRAASPD